MSLRKYPVGKCPTGILSTGKLSWNQFFFAVLRPWEIIRDLHSRSQGIGVFQTLSQVSDSKKLAVDPASGKQSKIFLRSFQN